MHWMFVGWCIKASPEFPNGQDASNKRGDEGRGCKGDSGVGTIDRDTILFQFKIKLPCDAFILQCVPERSHGLHQKLIHSSAGDGMEAR